MTRAWMVTVLGIVMASGCYGGQEFEWEARAVIAVERQAVPASAIVAQAGAPRWLSVRTLDADVVYPLRIDGDQVVLDSAYDGAAFPVSYDPFDAATAARPRPGSLAIELAAPFPRPPNDQAPGELSFTADFEISVLGDGAPVRIPVRLVPRLDPCAYQWIDPATPVVPIPANATTQGAPLVQEPTKIVVPPFAIRVFVQAACSESIG